MKGRNVSIELEMGLKTVIILLTTTYSLISVIEYNVANQIKNICQNLYFIQINVKGNKFLQKLFISDEAKITIKSNDYGHSRPGSDILELYCTFDTVQHSSLGFL